MAAVPGEFELIERYLAPLAADSPGALGLRDDAALLTPPDGCELVLTVDALVSGVHFLPDDPAGLVARKLLRVNLSDLAAMGAQPLGYLMTLAWPGAPEEAWIAASPPAWRPIRRPSSWRFWAATRPGRPGRSRSRSRPWARCRRVGRSSAQARAPATRSMSPAPSATAPWASRS